MFIFLVPTINSKYTAKPFSQTHHNMKHSHCSSLPIFAHASNLAECNSEDFGNGTERSCYFQPFFKTDHQISRLWQTAHAGDALAQPAPMQAHRMRSSRNQIQRPAFRNVLSFTLLFQKETQELSPPLTSCLSYGSLWDLGKDCSLCRCCSFYTADETQP